jgi:hypothetical protein
MPHSNSRAAGRRAGWTCLVALAAWLVAAPASRAVSLAPEQLPVIQATTFEVVAAKPEHDPLTYEKPLPLDLLPFQERNDAYYSIGTAFAIGDGRYATAAHVLMAGADSLWGLPALRDNGGQVYGIDKIVKFSMQQDFAVFTLKKQPGTAALPTNTAATAGQTVFSVGNAYGTGVVIRDGLYTSDTPEQQDGRWKWMRFSAAASPGNSGGPLVDQDGKVIGVVLAKSPNENLNYALPIRILLDAPEGQADIDVRTGYQFDVFDSTISGNFRERFALPLGLEAFYATYMARMNAFFDGQLKALLDSQSERLFPRGEGSERLLHGIADMGDLPRIVARDGNGTWVLAGSQDNDTRLSANGYVTPGAFGKNMLFHLRRPDDVPADKLYGDPAVAMDLLLRTGSLRRTVGTENITVKSLGKPAMDAVHVDAWGRRWRVWEWPIPYANARLVTLALPVPDGYVGISRYAMAMQEHDQLINLKALTDFAYVNLDGTLAQWRDYLARKDLRPAALDGVAIDFDYGKRFRYASRRMELGFTPELQAIQPDSVLTLGFMFYPDGGKVVWDVAELWLSAKGNDNNYVMAIRARAANASMDDDDRDEWDRILHRRHPNDATARDGDDRTRITAVVGAPADQDPAVLYTAHYVEEGKRSPEAMKAKLDLLLEGLQVHEH